MRDHTARYRRMRQIFSTDKHWIFIILIASNFVLLSLVLVIFNQDYGLFSKKSLLVYEQPYINTEDNIDKPVVTTVTFFDHINSIHSDFYKIFSGVALFSKNSQNVNEYLKEYNFDPKSSIKISSLEYVIGQKYVSTSSGRKVTYEMDKQIKWLSSLDSGIQKTKKYDPLVKTPVETTILVKKIGNVFYYVSDYLSPTRNWVREYLGYDQKQKQIVTVTFSTNVKSVNSEKVPEYSSDILSILGQLEGQMSTESNSAGQ